MSTDMTKDPFTGDSYAQIALEKLAPVDPNFRIYRVGWIGDDPSTWNVMKITGAIFRKALRGPDKGKLSIKIPNSTRTTYVTKQEMIDFDTTAPSRGTKSRRLSRNSPTISIVVFAYCIKNEWAFQHHKLGEATS